MRLLSVEEFHAELERRNCTRLHDLPSGASIWMTPGGEPFSVPAPEELQDGRARYPDWMLDDLIEQVGIPVDGKPVN